MIKKINLKKWYVAVLIIALLVFSLACWVKFARYIVNNYGKSDSAENENNTVLNTKIEIENQNLSSQTAFGKVEEALNKIDTKVSEFDGEWYSMIFKKQVLSDIDSKVTYKTTGQIVSSQVAFGYNNWMFYVSNVDGDCVGDYEGTNYLSDAEMDVVLNSALEAQKSCEEKGIEFAILVLPNKDNVYYDYMPKTYIHADVSKTDKIVECLSKNGVNIVFPKAEFLAQKSICKSDLYYRYDSHWNEVGAYIGIKELLKSFDIEIQDINERNIIEEAVNGNYDISVEDDLSKMVGLQRYFTDEKKYKVQGTIDTDWKEFQTVQESSELSHYENENALVDSSILLVGDSFRTSSVPVLRREVFKNVYIAHSYWYNSDMIENIDIDYLVFESVERLSNCISIVDTIIK